MENDIAEIHRIASEALVANVEKIADDQWELPTPNTEWNVRDLVAHLVGGTVWVAPLLAGQTIAQVGDRFDGDQLGDDPLGAWARASEEAVTAVGREGVLDRIVHVSFGDIPGREYVSQLVCDHAIHGWDLARAIGADEHIEPDLVDFAYEFLAPQADGWRGAGVFGPEVELPPGADRQSALLALSGRRP